MVKVKEVAAYLQGKLSDEFRITDNVQLYNKYLEQKGKTYMPGTVRLLLDAPPVYDFGTYATVYRLEIEGDHKKRHDVEQLFIDFVAENNGKSANIGDYKFIGAYRRPTFSDFRGAGDGSNEDVFTITLDFELWTMLEGIAGSGIEVLIDNVRVPYVENSYIKNMGIVPNLHDSTKELPEFTGDDYEIAIPIVNNPKVLELLNEGKSNKPNIKHTIKTVYSPWYEVEQDYYLKNMVIRSANSTQGVSAAFSFTKAFPRKDLQIRIAGESYKTIPILSYSYALSANHTTTVKGGYETIFGEMQNHPIQTGYSIEVVLSVRELIEQLPNMYEYIKGNNSNAIYQIKDGIYEYDVVIKTASEAYEETPGIALRVAFIEADNG